MTFLLSVSCKLHRFHTRNSCLTPFTTYYARGLQYTRGEHPGTTGGKDGKFLSLNCPTADFNTRWHPVHPVTKLHPGRVSNHKNEIALTLPAKSSNTRWHPVHPVTKLHPGRVYNHKNEIALTLPAKSSNTRWHPVHPVTKLHPGRVSNHKNEIYFQYY